MHFCEPLWLTVMLGGAGHCVEKHQQEHQPVEVGGLDGHTAVLPECMIQLAQLVAKKRAEGVFLELAHFHFQNTERKTFEPKDRIKWDTAVETLTL